MKDNAAIDDSVIDHYRSKFDWAGGKGLKLELLKMLIDHKNTPVFFQAVSGSLPEVFLTDEPNTNEKKNSY